MYVCVYVFIYIYIYVSLIFFDSYIYGATCFVFQGRDAFPGAGIWQQGVGMFGFWGSVVREERALPGMLKALHGLKRMLDGYCFAKL